MLLLLFFFFFFFLLLIICGLIICGLICCWCYRRWWNLHLLRSLACLCRILLFYFFIRWRGIIIIMILHRPLSWAQSICINLYQLGRLLRWGGWCSQFLLACFHFGFLGCGRFGCWGWWFRRFVIPWVHLGWILMGLVCPIHGWLALWYAAVQLSLGST